MALILDDPQLEQLAIKLADRKQLNIQDVLKQALLRYLQDAESDKQTPDWLSNMSKVASDAASSVTLAEQIPVKKQFETPEQQKMFEDAMRIARHCASLPVLDNRSADEILGYNEYGYFD